MKRVIERNKPKSQIFKVLVNNFFSKNDVDRAVIEIKKDTATRSVKQNKLYWMWLGVIEDETGMPRLDYFENNKWSKGLHTRLKCDHLEKQFYEDNSVKIPSTKKLNTKEFTNYLERIDMAMAEMGIVLPHPEDLYWDAMGVKAP